MSRNIWGLTLALCLCLVGCSENRNVADNADEQAAPEVAARFCHIARIGSLAEMPEDVWDDASVAEEKTAVDDKQKKEPTAPKKKKADGDLTSMESLPASLLVASTEPRVAQDVSDDFLKIVEEAAQETTTDNGIRKNAQKQDELDLVVEQVEEERALEERARQETVGRVASPKAKPANLLRSADASGEEENGVVDSELGVEIIEENDEDGADVDLADRKTDRKTDRKAADRKTDESADAEELDADLAESANGNSDESSDVEDLAENADENREESVDESADEISDESADENENSNSDLDSGKTDRLNAQTTLRMEEELERQAEEFLRLVKNVPDDLRKELKERNFRNVSFRIIRIPGSFISGKTISEYYVVRTMDYVGSNLSEDFQRLSHSPEYSRWMNEMGRFLDIITLDKSIHDIWLEAPEFWNSEKDID